MPLNPIEVLFWLLNPNTTEKQKKDFYQKMTPHMNEPNGDAVLVEPHQKHINGQSDVETMLHTIIDHLREPIAAHVPELSHFFSGPWHNKTHKGLSHQHVFVPNMDMRETKCDYYLDIELPGVRDKSSINIEWTSNRKLLVEGLITRPSLFDTFGLSSDSGPRSRDSGKGGLGEDDGYRRNREGETELELDRNYGSVNKEAHIPISDVNNAATPYIIADEANGFEKNEDLFPINIADGSQLDDGDAHFSRIKSMPKDEVLHSNLHNADSLNPDRAASLTMAERNVGRYMRLFMFPVNVYMGGLRAKLEEGLLRIKVPKTKEALDESWRMTVE